MFFKIKKVFLLIILIFLQSCSGGKIGEFFETSFKNIEEPKTKKEIKNNLKDNEELKTKKEIKNNLKDNEELKTKKEIKNNLKDNLVQKSGSNAEKNKNIEESKIKEDIKNNLNNKKVKNYDKKSKKYKNVNEKKIILQKKKYKPQSYRIIFILKDVDPKDPTEDLRTILRNSDVNFEIEKIERFLNSKDESIKRN